jgi:hypothetical protein
LVAIFEDVVLEEGTEALEINFKEDQKNNDDRPRSGDTFRRIRLASMQAGRAGQGRLEPDLFWPSL